MLAITPAAFVPAVLNEGEFDLLCRLILTTKAESSRRVYRHTFSKWGDWCYEARIDPVAALHPDTILAFLRDQPVTHRTRKGMLSHLKVLARTMMPLAGSDPMRQVILNTVVQMKAPVENSAESERRKHALSPAEMRAVLNVWQGKTPTAVRNRALLALLVSTWLRRSEACALRWEDVDWHQRTVLVRHGKGDKERVAAIIGFEALDNLERWRSLSNPDGARVWVFCPLTKSEIGPDKPINPATLFAMIQDTATASGVDFSPHDLRRTGITYALSTDMPLHDAQQQAGHSQAATTLIYAQATDVARAGRRAKSILDEC